MTFVTVVLQLVLMAASYFMDRAKVSKEIKEKFFEWVKLAGQDVNALKLIEWADKQKVYLKENEWQETK